MKQIVLLWMMVGIGWMASAQTSDSVIVLNGNRSFQLQKHIPGSFSYLNVDVLGNLYLLQPNSRLVKYNSNGDSLAVFNEVRKYGTPTLIDVSNPLKTIVFYKSYGTVVVLDRFLSQRSSLDLRKQQVFMPACVANSYDNQLWIFDAQEFKLKKFSDDGTLLQESTDLRLMIDSMPAPTQLFDSENLVYCYDPVNGFFIFDYYGGWKNQLPFKNWQQVFVSGKQIYGIVDNELQAYSIGSLQLRHYPLPEPIHNAISVLGRQGRLYVLTEAGVDIYGLP